MLADILFYGWLWMKAHGYLFTPWTADEILDGRLVYRVWNTLHAPVNEVFGPTLFPYFQPHGGLPDILSWSAYLLLCFLQIFLVGFFVGVLIWKLAMKAAR